MPQPIHPSVQQAREALARRDLAAAYRATQVALRANPHDAHLHALLGIVLSESNDLSSGEWHFRRALELDEPQAEWLVNLAINLIRQGRAAGSDELFARANELTPGNLEVLAQWSRLHEMLGNLQRADELLDQAAAASSASDVERLRVTYQIRRGRRQEALAALEAAASLSGDAQLERGRLYDELGRHGEAWRDWEQGKAKLAAQAGIEYQARNVEGFFARMKQFFARANFELLPLAAERRDVPQPIFIMGLPRSGTTLMEQVLVSHSAVRPGGELTFAGEWPQLLGRLLPDAASFPEQLAHTWSADYRHVTTLLRDYYFARAEARSLLEPGKRFFIDKMPFNELWTPLVRMAFPHAKVIRIVRHPLDVCVSMLSHELTHGFNCGYRIDTIVHQLCAMFDLTQHYRRELGGSELTVKYEDFVREPESETRRLLEFLELPFEAACLDFHDTRRYTATPSYAQVAERLNSRSIARYRPYLDRLAPFVSRLQPWITALHYDVEYTPSA